MVDVKRVLHVAVDQARRVDERHQAELLLLRRRDLGVEVVGDTCKQTRHQCVRARVCVKPHVRRSLTR